MPRIMITERHKGTTHKWVLRIVIIILVFFMKFGLRNMVIIRNASWGSIMIIVIIMVFYLRESFHAAHSDTLVSTPHYCVKQISSSIFWCFLLLCLLHLVLNLFYDKVSVQCDSRVKTHSTFMLDGTFPNIPKLTSCKYNFA